MKPPLYSWFGALCLVAGMAQAGPHVSVGLRIGLPAPIYVREAPPARVVERVYVSPGAGYVWVPGHYTWVENRWVWMSGAWSLPPQPDAYWVDSRWSPETRQWTDAHWEIPVAASQPPPIVSSGSSAGTQVPVPTRPAPIVGPTSSEEIVVAEAPPPPIEEVVVASPGHGYIWVSGYWGWRDGRREWMRGHWERPPHRHAVWVAPRWDRRGSNYIYIGGSWR